jgi:hypothetical protein
MKSKFDLAVIQLPFVLALLCSSSLAGEEAVQNETATAHNDIKLVTALDKAYEDAYFRRRTPEWNQVLQKARTPDNKAFDSSARDQLLSKMRRIVDNRTELVGELRIVVVELITQNGPNAPRYDRAAVAWSLGKWSKEFDPLLKIGLVQLSKARPKYLEASIISSMRAGGSSNGVASVSDSIEAVVITYFNGKDWQSGTWFWLNIGAYSAVENGKAEVGKRESLPGCTGNLIDIVEVLQSYGLDKKQFGGAIYKDLFEAFPKGRKEDRIHK